MYPEILAICLEVEVLIVDFDLGNDIQILNNFMLCKKNWIPIISYGRKQNILYPRHYGITVNDGKAK